MTRVTIKDVAKSANVDLSTVSRILNSSFDTHTYAAATIDRVQKAAESLGYQPSVTARSLRTGKTMLLGLIVADIGNPFFSAIASHLDNSISKHGYRLVISSTNENSKRQGEHIDGMLAHGVDGLIVAPCGTDGLEKALKTHVPLVTIDRPLPEIKLPFIGLDNIAAGHMLADKIKNYGYKTIGVVIPEGKTDLTLQERLQGLRSGLKNAKCTLAWTVTVPPTVSMSDEVSSEVAAKLKKITQLPDVIVGMTNVCTIGVIKALEDLDLTWGESLGLAGIDDFTAAPVVKPAITVVSQPLKQIATETFSLLLRHMKSSQNNMKEETIRVNPIWIERKSLPFNK